MTSFFSYIIEVMPRLLEGLGLTVYLGITSFVLALILGTILLLIFSINNRVINQIIRVYVSFFRGTPLLMQLFLFYYGLPLVFEFLITLDKNTALIISMAFNSSAYVFEALRGAVSSVDRGQYEASISFGISHYQTLKRIIFPQAIVSAIPALMNALMNLILMSSIGMTIGIQELTGLSQLLTATNYRIFETYVIAITLYWILSMVFERLQAILEFRIGHIYRR